jgi:hypothetical protein
VPAVAPEPGQVVARGSRPRKPVAVLAAVLGLLAGVGACKAKASASQCDQLLDRYATLVVTEKLGADASAGQIHDEQQREKSEARGDDAFKNCSSEVSQAELDCALHAPTADAFEKCLE